MSVRGDGSYNHDNVGDDDDDVDDDDECGDLGDGGDEVFKMSKIRPNLK